MSNKPLVSIIMSTYNAEDSLAKSLDSVINQTYENIEILIMDDCSDDLSYQILKDYESNFCVKFIPLFNKLVNNPIFFNFIGIDFHKLFS